jgi:enoyl-CoA hydratase/carnithine racemase
VDDTDTNQHKQRPTRQQLLPQLVMSSSRSYPTTTLFNRDGVSVTATILADEPSAALSKSDIEHDGLILTLHLHRDAEKNVINPTMIELLVEALDVVEKHELCTATNNKSLIITGMSPPGYENDGAHGKFFSNGLDLQWFTTSEPSSRPLMIENFCSKVLARILTLPMRTVAAIQGHCIGAGLFIALACDYRIMRSQRGFVQWPETRLGMRLTKGFAELSKAKILDHAVLREGVLSAKKYTPEEALKAGIVDSISTIESLYRDSFRCAVEGLPEKMGLEYFDPKTFTEVKTEMYTDAYRALRFGKVGDLPHSRI